MLMEVFKPSMISLLVLLFQLFPVSVTIDEFTSIDKYEIISNIEYDGSTGTNNNLYPDKQNIKFNAFGKTFGLRLNKNDILIPDGFKVHYQTPDGNFIQSNETIENCFYQGAILGDKNSIASFSTCNGVIYGVIRTQGGPVYEIQTVTSENLEPIRSAIKTENIMVKPGNYIIYTRNNDFFGKQHVCPMTKTNQRSTFGSAVNNTLNSAESNKINIHGKKYIELIVCMDKANYERHGSNEQKTITAGISVIQNTDTIYKHFLNSRVALRELYVWKFRNEITIDASAQKTLGIFTKYTRDKIFGSYALKGDVALLLTGIDFTGSYVGFAGVGVTCSKSGALVVQDRASPAYVSGTVAHEIGHTLGLVHNDKSGCDSCDKCIMDSVAHGKILTWSDCSRRDFLNQLREGKYTCLYNYPDKIYGGPTCGNGFIETGEECDCGSEEECKESGGIRCCIPKTCKLQPTAKCAEGPCCLNCQPRETGYLCRSTARECDLPEYCNGVDVVCPNNLHKHDGSSCDDDNGYCMNGKCKSPDLQCKKFFGENAVRGWDECFDLNTNRKDGYANCGLKGNEYIACAPKDKYCGKIQCMPRSPNLEIKPEGDRYVQVYDKKGPPYCKLVRLLKKEKPVMLAEAKTKCGEGAVCDDQQKCRNLTNKCRETCLNGGVCNNLGHCHCPVGFACPNCENAGLGGSSDSGQGCTQQVMCCLDETTKLEIVIVLFLLIIILLVLCIIYMKKSQLQKRWDLFIHRKENPKGRVKTKQQGTAKSHEHFDKNHGNGTAMHHGKHEKVKIEVVGNKSPAVVKHRTDVNTKSDAKKKKDDVKTKKDDVNSVSFFSKAKNFMTKKGSNENNNKTVESSRVVVNPATSASSKITSFNEMDKKAKKGEVSKEKDSKGVKKDKNPTKDSKPADTNSKPDKKEKEKDTKLKKNKEPMKNEIHKAKDPMMDLRKLPSGSELTKVEDSPRNPPKHKVQKYYEEEYAKREREMKREKSPRLQQKQINIYNNEDAMALNMNKRVSIPVEHSMYPNGKNNVGDKERRQHRNDDNSKNKKAEDDREVRVNVNKGHPSPRSGGIMAQVNAYNTKDVEAGNIPQVRIKSTASPRVVKR